MRRCASVMVAACLVLAPLAPAHAAGPLEASARASVLFAEVNLQPSFDPALADSRASSSTIGTTSLQSVVWPSFLMDAFLFLYGFQSVGRTALGVAEARWPQGPTDARATHSDLLFANGGDPEMVPGKGGDAHARAAATGAGGDVAWADIELAGVGTIGTARSATSARTDGTAASSARQSVADIAIGPLTIELVRGVARATSGGQAHARLVIAGAMVAGNEVVIDDEGVRAFSDDAQDEVDAALEDSGLRVVMLPSTEQVRGATATASSGGLLVRVEGEIQDPTTGDTERAELGFILGAADAAARAVPSLPTPGSAFVPPPPQPIGGVTVEPAAPPETAPGPAQQIIRRTIITTVAAGIPIGARGAYAAVVLVALGLTLIRPLVRAAARP